MKLYVISADTYQCAWGSQISIFGIYDSLEKAENAIKELNKKDNCSYGIDETTMNEIREIYLGGYVE